MRGTLPRGGEDGGWPPWTITSRCSREVAVPSMTFEELARVMNEAIADRGYRNLDFLGNLGHSIVSRPEDRIYLEPGNRARLDSVDLFTVEPHICRTGGRFGYKHEDIYRFEEGRLTAI